MVETFVALFFAHVLADFVFQTGWMAARKKEPHILLAHVAVVWITAIAALGSPGAWPLILLAIIHFAIDAVKAHLLPEGLGSFMGDQAAHLASIVLIATAFPTLWVDGFFAAYPELLTYMIYASGLILATRAGGFAICILMESFGEEVSKELNKGLPQGGHAIGLLERGLIFVLIIAGQPGAIGFLIAAKSILRFGTVSEDRALSEYVIIGTLASFGWAIAVGFATIWLTELNVSP